MIPFGLISPLWVTGEVMGTGMELAVLAVEAQSVIAMRMMGMTGLWTMPRSENERMLREKPPAFTHAVWAAWAAALGGQRPDQVMAAAVRPLRRQTRRNVRRLGRSGPRNPFLLPK
ncbi:MAG: antifreeze protein [Qingshengfaniella sp.]